MNVPPGKGITADIRTSQAEDSSEPKPKWARGRPKKPCPQTQTHTSSSSDESFSSGDYSCSDTSLDETFSLLKSDEEVQLPEEPQSIK